LQRPLEEGLTNRQEQNDSDRDDEWNKRREFAECFETVDPNPSRIVERPDFGTVRCSAWLADCSAIVSKMD
jgi:hypothetical protein